MNSYWLIGVFTLVTQLFVFFRWLHRRLRDAAIERGLPQARAPLRAVPAGAIAVPSQGPPVFPLDTAWRIMYIMLRCDAGGGWSRSERGGAKGRRWEWNRTSASMVAGLIDENPSTNGLSGWSRTGCTAPAGFGPGRPYGGRRCGTGGACGCGCGAWR